MKVWLIRNDINSRFEKITVDEKVVDKINPGTHTALIFEIPDEEILSYIKDTYELYDRDEAFEMVHDNPPERDCKD